MEEATHAVTRPATPIAVAVVEHNDCFLIGERPPGVVLAGYWEFPGGKVHDAEEPAACAVRECREETGMEVEVARLLCNCDYEYDHGRLHLQFFLCRPFDPRDEPRPPFRWVERRDLAGCRFPPANKELLNLLFHNGDQPLPTKLM
jgi:8-oxo-dGTP diphosphatase